MAKYKVGDKVKIRKDLVVGNKYGGLVCLGHMKKEVEEKGNVVTIIRTGVDSEGVIWYEFEELFYAYSEEMIEEPTDREKFEAWMTKLAEIDVDEDNDIYHAFERVSCYYSKGCHSDDYYALGIDIDILWEYINRIEVKEMTKAEIEEALGYKIEIVED